MSKPTAMCELCGEPMSPGEEMFKYHGYSGPCPKPAGPHGPAMARSGRFTRPKSLWELRAEEAERERDDLLRLAKEATNGWACHAKSKAEHDEIARLHAAIAKAVEK